MGWGGTGNDVWKSGAGRLQDCGCVKDIMKVVLKVCGDAEV